MSAQELESSTKQNNARGICIQVNIHCVSLNLVNSILLTSSSYVFKWHFWLNQTDSHTDPYWNVDKFYRIWCPKHFKYFKTPATFGIWFILTLCKWICLAVGIDRSEWMPLTHLIHFRTDLQSAWISHGIDVSVLFQILNITNLLVLQESSILK